MGAANLRIATEMGLFQKHGLQPKFIVMDSGSAAATALISGSVNVIQAGMGELVAARAAKQDVVGVLNLYGRTSATMVLAKSVADKLGVSPTASPTERLKALDGLLIATTTATSSTTISYLAAAKRAGATFRSAFMGQAAMPAALDTGAVQGFASAGPFWTVPVTRGTGVVWLSGPKGELPADLMTASANQIMMMRPFAEKNPDLVKRLRDVYADFVKALDERPADVKAAIIKLYPDIERPVIDMLFESEKVSWNAKPLTPEDVAKEISFMKGMNLPGLDQIDPVASVFK